MTHGPAFARSYYQLGLVLDGQDKSELALAAFDHALALDSQLGPAYLARGMARLKKQQWADAIKDLNSARGLRTVISRASLAAFAEAYRCCAEAEAKSGDEKSRWPT